MSSDCARAIRILPLLTLALLWLLATGCADEATVSPSPVTLNTPQPTSLPVTRTPATSGATATSAPASETGWRVVAEFPHDPAAFTQGLVYVDGELWEGTGLVGASSLRQVELTSGRVLRQADLAEPHFGEGIAVIDDRVIQLTWQSEVAFVHDRATLEVVTTLPYEGEGWGMAWDGTRLVTSDGSATLTFRDPMTFAPTGTLVVQDAGQPVDLLNELEWVDGEMWAAVWMADQIARIDPLSGAVTGWLDVAALYPPEERADPDRAVFNGIAWDAASGRIFVTGKLWPRLFEIALVEPE